MNPYLFVRQYKSELAHINGFLYELKFISENFDDQRIVELCRAAYGAIDELLDRVFISYNAPF